MKSGIRNNKTLKLVGATSVTLFSLVAVFAASIAWFAANKQNDSSGMGATINSVNGRLNYVYFHALDDNTPDNTTYSFNKTPFATYQYNWESQQMQTVGSITTSSWEMGDYTSLDKNHRMLMIFEFDKDYVSTAAGDMFVRATTTVGGNSLVYAYADSDTEHTTPLYTTDGGGYLGARTSAGAPYYSLPQTLVKDDDHPERILIKKENGHDYYALSSVALFRNRTFSDAQYTTFKNSGTTLDFAENSMESDETFTTILNDSDKYLFNQTPYIFKSNGSETVKYVAIIIDFSMDAIGYIYSTYLGDSGLNNYDSILHFACDWSLEVY